MLTLYYSPGACSLVPHIALQETGAEFETVRTVIADGDHCKPEYLALNPRARVPVLREDDFVLTENIAILSYIARRFPDAGIFPSDNGESARVYELLSFFVSSVHIAFAQFWRMERFTNDVSLYPAIQEYGRLSLLRYFGEIETLTDGAFLVAGRLTPADSYLLTFYRWGIRIGVEMSAYAGWTRHTERTLADPSVAAVVAKEGIIMG
jgi:glutathione S-transferase